MSALDSLQPEECLQRFLSSDLLELVLSGTELDCRDAFPLLDYWTTPTPASDEREAPDSVPLESRIHKYVQASKQVPVQLMSSLCVSSFCEELRQSLSQLTARKVLIADRLKPKVLLKEVKGEIEILMRKAARRQKGKNKENEDVRRPLSLPCGHTFCEVCLSKIMEEQRILCPNCRAVSSSAVCELPVNYIAQELARQHHDRQKKCLSCPIHPTEMLRFYCNSCNCGLCAECIIAHSGHQFVKYEESVMVLRNKADEARRKVEESSRRLHAYREDVESSLLSLRSKSEVELLKIESEFGALSLALDARRAQLKAEYLHYLSIEHEKLAQEAVRIKEQKEVFLQELAKIKQGMEVLDKATDADLANNRLAEVLMEQGERVKTLDAEIRAENSIQLNVPEFILFARQSRELLGSMGAIINDSNDDFEILQPTLSFFGDKNQVMTFDLIEQRWDLRSLFSQYEFSYYAAAVTLPDGSALITGGGSFAVVLHYKNGKLYARTSMAQIRKEHAAVYLNGYVYVMGGYDGHQSQFLRECEKYSTIADEWTAVAPMNIARCAFSATAVNSKFIYIFGGYDGVVRLSSIEKYDPEEDRWILLPLSLKSPLSNSACFSTRKNQIIVLGGGLSTGFSLNVQLLDIETGVWTSLPMMTEGRDLRNKVAFYGNKVYCVGGYNFKAEVLALDREEWEQLSNYPVGDNLDSWSCALTYRRSERRIG